MMDVHVVHVIARLNVGGPAAIIEALTSVHSEELRHTVLAGHVGRGEESWNDLRGNTITAIPIPTLSPSVNVAADVAALRTVRSQLKRLRPDLVHTHTAKGGLVGRLAAGSLGIPTVHTFHGHVLQGYFGPTTTRFYTSVERALAVRTARLLTVGRRVGQELLAAGVGRPEQYRTVIPAVAPPTPWDRAAARAELGLPDDAAVVLMLGRLTAVKRVDRGIQVVRRLQQGGRQVTLLIAGGGELEGDLRAQCKSLDPRVRFLGWISDVGLPLAAADVLLLTSDNEGMPVGLIEAATVGLPTVATDVGSVGEVVEHESTGFIVPPAVDVIADAVAGLLDDEHLRADMGRRAVRVAAERFTPARLVLQHEQIYREVLT